MTFMRGLISIALVTTLASPLWAAGSGSSEPKPKTVTCTKGNVFSESKGKCVPQQDSSLTDEDRIEELRSLAYAGHNAEAQALLSALEDPTTDQALTYWGFTHRKLGNVDTGMVFYAKALEQNPNNLLARSYLGQAHVEAGRFDLARLQLTEIRERGGEGSWPEASLAEALRSGITFNY
ncbi:tetratricopeptide repeat protein [Shimia sagamensis]|uniref:Tetratricopeptide repeat-containing protein n=1 Tax=Shimia sagamensis TaxID=1566352 RepID=A0ABY1PJN7_9RHOB|nr:tetratricopeptide repeat protein [Shimia sagamensis]SMP35176.1 Tetratricopeptide repeat-containing protein [Shimia sagamensis]